MVSRTHGGTDGRQAVSDDPLAVTVRGSVIPADELTWRFSRSPGPGGQSVNTTDSRVSLSFDLGASGALRPELRDRALAALAGRLTGGVLTVTASEFRSQLRNRVAAAERMSALLTAATAAPPRPRRPTRPTRASRERRLADKQRRSEVKTAAAGPRRVDQIRVAARGRRVARRCAVRRPATTSRSPTSRAGAILMTDRLDGTVALVTGASSGIGEAAAIELASHGAAVALAARRTDRLTELAAKIRADGGTAAVFTADVTLEEEAQALVEQTVAELGRLDTLINNAGVMLLGPVQDAPTEEWRRMVNVNLLGLLYCAHAALPHLLRAADGGPRQVADLVNISSVAGRVARNGSGVYNATKHGVGAFSEALRQEVTRRHVRVSLVEPGATSTELASHNRPEIRERMGQRFAGMERLEAADIAETIAFIVTRPRRMAVNEVLVRPTEQEG